MTEPNPGPEALRKRRLSRTVLGGMFFGWWIGLVCGATMDNPALGMGLGLGIGVATGAIAGLLVAALLGYTRRPER
jgi:hypothetical protein